MADYINREAALESAWHNYYPSIDHYCASVKCATRKDLEAIPAADVRPVGEISDAVDEAIDFLNSVSCSMPYHVYSALFDLICRICPNCGADMREVEP